ncbi:MAG: hypothetical protein ACYS9H_09700, partial [Planctomycetota bacterium]
KTDAAGGQIILIDMVGADRGGGHKLHGAGLKQVGIDFGNTPYQQDIGVFDTFGRNLTPRYQRNIANLSQREYSGRR